MAETRYRLTAAQMAYRRSSALYRGLVGGIGSGKSWIGALDLIRRARPGRLYMAVGPTYIMLRDASLRSFLGHARALDYLKDFRRADMTAVLGNGAEVIFRTAEDPERLRGPNLSGAWLDEASLMPREAFDISIGRLREGGEQGFLGATFTPKGRQHWTFQVFASGGPDAAVFRSRTTDNPFLPGRFADAIRRQYTDEMARQELEGEFLEEGVSFLFPDEWLRRSVQAAERLRGRPRKAAAGGCDPAEGGDRTTLAAVDELGVIEVVSAKTPDTSVITGEALAFMRRHAIPPANFCFDAGGGGKQHADRLRAQGCQVRTVAFGEAVVAEIRARAAAPGERREVRDARLAYYNRRAQMYGELSALLDPGNPDRAEVFAIPAECAELRRQLAPIPKTFDLEGKLKLLPKNRRPDGKEKCLADLLGRSPDEADAVVLAVHAMLHRAPRFTIGAR